MGKQRKRQKSPQEEPDEGSSIQKTTEGPDESQKGPPRDSTPLEGESSPRCSASPNLARLSIADILGNVSKCWEIEVSTHLPLHLEWCHECNRFVQHVADCCKGGLDSFIKIQKDHWIKELDNVFLNAFDDGYNKAMDKN